MTMMRSVVFVVVCLSVGAGCTQPEKPYGREAVKALSLKRRQVWAMAPVINLSGERGVEPFLQADIAFSQLQQVRGVTVIPVNRVAEVYAALRIEKISSPEQAALVCDLLQCDGLIVPTVTIYDAYNPPKFGATLNLFVKPGAYVRPKNVDPRDLAKRAAPVEADPMPVAGGDVVQAVGMFDASNGSVRDRVRLYAAGRFEPAGPLGEKEYYVNMDRYCGFAYSELIEQLIASSKLKGL